MASRKIGVEAVILDVDGRRIKLDSSLTREDVIALLGSPDDVGAASGKRPKGQILLYGNVEIHFDQTHRVFLVYSDEAEFVRLSIPLGKQL